MFEEGQVCLVFEEERLIGSLFGRADFDCTEEVPADLLELARVKSLEEVVYSLLDGLKLFESLQNVLIIKNVLFSLKIRLCFLH